MLLNIFGWVKSTIFYPILSFFIIKKKQFCGPLNLYDDRNHLSKTYNAEVTSPNLHCGIGLEAFT